MTRIAVISDIHGNSPALEAVLADLEGAGVDEVLVGGDLVGRGPEGSRVVQRIRELGYPTIAGNHEEYLLAFRRGEVPSDWLGKDDLAAARWMAAELAPEDAAWIAQLPFSLARPGLLLVHGSPASNRDGIGPWTRDHELAAHLAAVAEPVLVCAHTHRPLLRELPDGLVVNVGSVGLPFNGDRRAQYAVFETSDGPWGWELERHKVEYDVAQTLEIYERSGFLAAGGVTARLLSMELEHAAPLLVPFLEWCRIQDLQPGEEHLESFLAFHQPGDPMRELFERLQELA